MRRGLAAGVRFATPECVAVVELDGTWVFNVRREPHGPVPRRLAGRLGGRDRAPARRGLRNIRLLLPACTPDHGRYARELPGVRWKLRNLGQLQKANPKKFAEQSTALARLLGN